MKFFLSLRLMVLAITKERGRMSLVVIMVAVGVGSVMVLFSLGNGANQAVQAVLAKSGRDLMVISPVSMQYLPGRGEGWYLSQSLKQKDAVDISENIDGVLATAPVSEQQLIVKYADNDHRTMIQGVTSELTELRNYQLEEGRFLSAEDYIDRNKAAVIGSFVSEKLNSGFSLLGETILIDNSSFLVVGELKEKGLSKAGTNYDDLILVPIETANSRLFKKNYVDRIIAKYEAGSDVNDIQDEIIEIIGINHNLSHGDKRDFKILIEGADDLAKQTTNSLLGGLAIFFTVITLIAAGIGVLTVSYLNVLDRKAEIGLRMALGSTRRGIAVMIVVEAAILSAVGALSGILLGFIAINIFRQFFDWELVVDLSVVVLPFAVAILLGITFSMLPAGKAARLLPVDALRAD